MTISTVAKSGSKEGREKKFTVAIDLLISKPLKIR